MTFDHARKAQVGNKVQYRSAEETLGGTITEVEHDGFTIKWDDGLSCSVSYAKQKCRTHLNNIEFC